MNSVERSILFSAADRYGSLILVFVATAILARLLSPAEFGVYAVVTAITTVIGASFFEFGGGNYLIQKRELSTADVRSAFTITLGISVAIALLLFVLAGPLSELFAQDSLRKGIQVAALNFVLVPFHGTTSALLRRDMKFGTLAVCNLATGAATAVASIVLAMAGFSYMAPIWGGLAGSIVFTVMLLANHRDWGVLRPSLLGHREVVNFGLYSSAVSVINLVYNLAPQLLLAKILDFGSVGLYTRATNLTQMFDRLVAQALNPVIMPAIVAQRRAGADLKAVYLEAVELLSAVQWPFLIFVALMAQPIVLIWLGQTWLEIVPLVRILCIANLALFAACLTYPVFLAVGSVRDALVSSLISLPPSLLVVLGASFFGVEAVASAALATLPFQTAVVIYFLKRHLAFSSGEFFRASLKSGLVTFAMAPGVLACAALIEAGMLTSLTGLILSFPIAGLGWWCGLIMTGHPLLHQLRHVADGLFRSAPRLRRSRPA
ncbi:polysaccharide biosynthesis protein [Bradyrhizobium yuanmingense]|uniref:Polysaccharide biosynthesis protein n=1 Tax=Bradyrhizobium yuanmingense TaxID=108015 RepID=A0A0R3C267_9BRAD|nr:lipopolysaccharide biosynthesis protein [Bradyrhizobium yuanmingense]KRP91711.1 polysaccharide biosynthesis protein [Bradyrhizobium yuanmingense]